MARLAVHPLAVRSPQIPGTASWMLGEGTGSRLAIGVLHRLAQESQEDLESKPPKTDRHEEWSEKSNKSKLH